jgi:predicted 3-demethylubiquinone-9 3-methyltransferase (glyoxalase superfamily)
MPDLSSPEGQRAMEAFMEMKKIDIAELKRAMAGAAV